MTVHGVGDSCVKYLKSYAVWWHLFCVLFYILALLKVRQRYRACFLCKFVTKVKETITYLEAKIASASFLFMTRTGQYNGKHEIKGVSLE